MDRPLELPWGTRLPRPRSPQVRGRGRRPVGPLEPHPPRGPGGPRAGAKRMHELVTSTARVAGTVLADCQYACRPFLEGLLRAGFHLVARARMNTVAFEPAPQVRQRGRGRPKKYGKKVVLREFFACKALFRKVEVELYGRRQQTLLHEVVLYWQTHRVKFIVSIDEKGRKLIFLSTRTSLSAESIVASLRLEVQNRGEFQGLGREDVRFLLPLLDEGSGEAPVGSWHAVLASRRGVALGAGRTQSGGVRAPLLSLRYAGGDGSNPRRERPKLAAGENPRDSLQGGSSASPAQVGRMKNSSLTSQIMPAAYITRRGDAASPCLSACAEGQSDLVDNAMASQTIPRSCLRLTPCGCRATLE